jgi:LmbE family N-acetylglucosaminyl deacetylase
VPEQRRILAVYAHPDDAEIWAGGTLLAHRAQGDHTAICVLTHAGTDRALEARRGAAALGADLHHRAFPDRALRDGEPAIEAVAQVLRHERPQIIITHWADDSHPDHRATWAIVRSAIMLAEAESDVRALFWSDTYNGAGETGLFQPDTFVDVSGHWEAKLEALTAHQSQGPEHYVAMVSRQCSLHGARSGVRYAEGFVRVSVFGRGRRARASLWDSL